MLAGNTRDYNEISKLWKLDLIMPNNGVRKYSSTQDIYASPVDLVPFMPARSWCAVLARKTSHTIPRLDVTTRQVFKKLTSKIFGVYWDTMFWCTKNVPCDDGCRCHSAIGRVMRGRGTVRTSSRTCEIRGRSLPALNMVVCASGRSWPGAHLPR